VGSTEACLLAGLALKMRWRAWHRETRGPTSPPGVPVPVVPVTRAVNDERPNLVISSLFQACWEKFFRYFDVKPRIVHPAPGAFSPDPQRVAAACDDNTIGVVCILGNHYTGWDRSVCKHVNRSACKPFCV
jgi:glutamate decarboxylase